MLPACVGVANLTRGTRFVNLFFSGFVFFLFDRLRCRVGSRELQPPRGAESDRSAGCKRTRWLRQLMPATLGVRCAITPFPRTCQGSLSRSWRSVLCESGRVPCCRESPLLAFPVALGGRKILSRPDSTRGFFSSCDHFSEGAVFCVVRAARTATRDLAPHPNQPPSRPLRKSRSPRGAYRGASSARSTRRSCEAVERFG